MNLRNLKQLNADPANQTPSGGRMTLADLDDDPIVEGKEGTQTPPPSIKSGGENTPPDLERAAQEKEEAEKTEFETLLDKKPEERTNEEKQRFEELSEKFEVQETDEEGNPIDKEKAKEIEDKVNAILKKPEAERTEEEKKFLDDNTEEEETDIYSKVEELNGYKVEVDYGDVDPKSPEGVALREQKLIEMAENAYEQDLQRQYPRAHSFLQHLLSGGKEEDFFKPENSDYLSIKLDKKDDATSENVLRQALALKGNTPAQIDVLVQAAKDTGSLYDDSKIELEALQQKQRAKEEDRTQALEKAEQLKQSTISNFVSKVETQVTKEGKIGNIVIPKEDRGKFADYLLAHSRYVGDGKIVIAKAVSEEDFDNEARAAYFAYKKGDVQSWVERTAQTQNARRIKNRVITRKSSVSGSSGARTNVRLADL